MVERTGSGVPVRAFIEDDLVVFSGIAGQKNHRVFAGVAAVGNHKAQGAGKKITIVSRWRTRISKWLSEMAKRRLLHLF